MSREVRRPSLAQRPDSISFQRVRARESIYVFPFGGPAGARALYSFDVATSESRYRKLDQPRTACKPITVPRRGTLTNNGLSVCLTVRNSGGRISTL
ncbi:hypothetical protein EVAR_94297_1 [Eumeta japonica]|uniref:Uncharacterized protein n=1 Tax=Eumeta variegata TaxID=151549 RepID=A0A4C1UEU2_EUMVA|nr:hypothetical protein EVAR_94297_1 [Eumeta japonica]